MMNQPVVLSVQKGISDLHRVFDRQREAFQSDQYPSVQARRWLLKRLEAMVIGHEREIAQAIGADFGHRSADETKLLEVVPTLNAIRYAYKRAARWMKPQRRHVSITFQPGRSWVIYQPLGVVGIVVPWNYPLYLAIAPLTDALAAGNRAIIKPSESTPLFAELLHQIVQSRFDESEVAVVTGGPDVAQALCSLPLDHLLFTGSARVARQVMKAAAENLTPVTLELGGKSPAIVCPDYSIDKAARSIALGKFLNAGQTCVAPDYVLAPAEKVTQVAQSVLEYARRFYPRIDHNGDYTSIVSDRHYKRLLQAIEEAGSAGATILRYDDVRAEERKIGPTIVLEPPRDCLLMREEIFGPVLPIVTYRTIDEALGEVTRRERPLALYCFTNDKRLRQRILMKTFSGGVTVNGTLLHVAQEDLPFGGVGPSGMGAYHGFEGFKRFSHARAVFAVGFMNGSELLAPPYGKLARLVGRLLIGRRRQAQRRVRQLGG